ncbi:hypothetical protein RHSIM_Rhsim08G0167900 [Rhododendron simsii]|uniref:Alpha-N-acetylglucosaminidase n=1 Tax=Rhododendron simsii TaxID=118357 RepID=A0A834GIS2_RHOSS|nr:hypothetical protein RHSIM_Rhsim08G0167900 [Rhododendron simsii]
MASPFPANSSIIFFIITFSFCTFSVTRSSTVGVGYISRLFEIQDRERAPPAVQISAAGGALDRLIPSHSSSFEFRIVSKERCGGESCFIVHNSPSLNDKSDLFSRISGVTGVELSAGMHWYIKHWCGAHVSWDKTGGVQLSSVPKPGSLPRVQDSGILIQRPMPWHYYQNAVTSSYTFAWWDWERWEKEIDWMALQGINLPLAFTGQEAIWQKVFQNFNISSSDLNDFFGGPAFLAWARMGNLHGWGGPLPQTWLDQQLTLQKKILARMFEFGMTPVLPAFSGNVPAALKTIFPSASITRLANWFTVGGDSRWCCTFLLDATDPLFVEIGKAFVQEQSREYGRTSHIYNCDTFDENTPPVDDPDYISSLGAAIYRGMQSGDENAVWLMQVNLFPSCEAWFRIDALKALLHSVPFGRLVVLDLFAEVKPLWPTSDQFYGIPYIWQVIIRFPSFLLLYVKDQRAIQSTINSLVSWMLSMVGVGMSMEGIEQSPVAYDLMAEMAFQHDAVDVKMWIDTYSSRRYGRYVSSMQDAWSILYHTVYNCTDGTYDKNRDVIVAFPDIDPTLISFPKVFTRQRYDGNIKPISRRAFVEETVDSSYDQPHLWYSTSEAVRALELFIKSGDELSGSDTYRYDLVDLTRQALAKYANELFLMIIEAYRLGDVRGVAHQSQKFIELVEDMDTLLACHEGFLLGPWLASAKQLAQNEEQKKQYEWNARTKITMWFDNTEEEASLLRDYGNKYWSGLLKDYYGPRAAIYFKYLMESLEKGDGFHLKDWRREWVKLTNDWQSSRNLYLVESIGDALNASKWLHGKYLPDPDTY